MLVGMYTCWQAYKHVRMMVGIVTFRQAKTVSALYGWPTDLSARRVRLRRDFKSRGSPAHREFSRR